jgi:hypothetical protein
MSKAPNLQGAWEKTRPEETRQEQRERLYNKAATPGRKKLRGITYYGKPELLTILHEIAKENADENGEPLMIKSLSQEAYNLLLMKYGKSPIA